MSPGGADGLDFEAFEQAGRRGALGVAARWVERRLNADRSDYQGPTVSCACGQTARYAGRRPKTFTTVFGPMTLKRAYYHCAACKAGVYPRDWALGLQDTSFSPATTRMVGLAAARDSFAEASKLLEILAGLRVETKQVERTAEALGREVAADERRVVEPAPGGAPTMYLGLDGTGVPVRKSEVDGRRGKQPDGSAKTREVKLVTVWTAEGCDKKGLPRRDLGSVSYSAAVESAASRDTDPLASAFAQRVHREARRRGFDAAPRRVVLGDGAEWIWNLAGEQFPGAVEIVDPLPCQGASVRRGQGRLRRRHGPGRPVGQGPEGRLGPGTAPGAREGGPCPHRDHRRGAQVHFLPVPQPPPDALSAVSGAGLVRLLGGGGGRMQARDRRAAQTRRHALDGGRRQRHHRAALLRTQWPLRGFLGTTSRERRVRAISQI